MNPRVLLIVLVGLAAWDPCGAQDKKDPSIKDIMTKAHKGGNSLIAQVAKELKIYDSTLGNWVRQAREEAAGAPSVEERAEIRELRGELERVTRERDLLAKCVAFFSGSTRTSG